MSKKSLEQIVEMYDKSQELLATGDFGSGLWPVDPEIGQYMSFIIRLYGLKKGFEVGAGVGYGSAWLIDAFLHTGGNLTAFEYFRPKLVQWKIHMLHVFGDEVEKCAEIVAAEFSAWVAEYAGEEIDFMFFDQRKCDYLAHLKLLLPHLQKGAFICADNVLSHQKSCSDYLDFVRSDDRFVSSLFECGDGLEVTRYCC